MDRDQKNDDKNGNNNGNNLFGKNLLLWAVVALVIAGVFNMFSQERPGLMNGQSVVAYSDFIADVDKKQVSDVIIANDAIRGHYTDGRTFITYIPTGTDIVSKIESK